MTRDNPLTVAPADWKTNGIEYGAFCKCSVCCIVERSTFTFDFYAKEPGDSLKCETCTTGRPHEMCNMTVPEMLACAKREHKIRVGAYPRWVASGRMSESLAERELARMEAIVEHFQELSKAVEAEAKPTCSNIT